MLVAMARERYRRSDVAVDVTDMADAEALAVADLTRAQQRAHARYVKPEEQVEDCADAVLLIAQHALLDAGVELESATAKVLGPRHVSRGAARMPRKARHRARGGR